MPGLTLGDTIPNLEVETTHGKFKLHDFIGQDWTIIFSHPGDFTPVCTTELGKMAAYTNKFQERGVKLLGLSCDDVQTHNDWIKDIEAYSRGSKVEFPIIADPDMEVIKELNMVDPDEKDLNGNQLPSRGLHVVGGDKKVKLSILYPATTGRNIDEVLRVVDSLQKTEKHKVATPENWKPGEPVMIAPTVSNEEAKELFPGGFETKEVPSSKDYLRYTAV
ncbi:1-Cys peroxiredoxin [Macadamia integrifolia]|uniref:1-Cys peroxiredoxin n=1 Tax=Macadamia integrifolia TaxID=60698 RepID=UPI001C53430B|nr:1-Cys peroxiredoxin [Macadamia integrifolia]